MRAFIVSLLLRIVAALQGPRPAQNDNLADAFSQGVADFHMRGMNRAFAFDGDERWYYESGWQSADRGEE